MTKKILTVTFSLGFFALSLGAAAQDKIGNGGHQSCASFIDYIARAGIALKNLKQQEIDKLNSVIQGEELYQASRKFTCVPAEELDRTARTLVVSNTEIRTTLKWKAWDALSKKEKLDLATHELAVGANVESEGQYFISRDIVSLVLNTRQMAQEKCSSIEYISGVFTCHGPQYVQLNLHFTTVYQGLKGICRYLGFGYGVVVATTHGYAPRGREVARLNNDGVLVERSERSHLLTSISCK